MLLLDDLLINPFVTFLDILHSMAVEEMYNIGEIHNDIKENRLLYELGERPEAEYEERKAELEELLEVAEDAHDRLGGRVEVLG
ncbi:gas vesicle protein GvpG [Haloferacaceae archaeon DSL9]